MSQVNFQLSENLVLNGYAVESAVVSTVPVLKFNGNILATQTFVSDAIAAISIPPAYITSVSGNLSVDGMGVLSLDESGVANDLASGSNFITNSGTQLNINLSSLETQLVTDGFYNSSNLPANYITSVSGNLSVDVNGNLTLNEGGIVQDIMAGAPEYLRSYVGALGDYIIDVNLSAIETQLTTDGYAKTSDIPSASAISSEITGGSTYIEAVSGASTYIDLNLSALESQLVTDGFAKTSDLSHFITSSDQYIQSTDSNFTVSGSELTLNTTISVDQIDVAGSGDFTVTGSANIVLQPAVGDYVYVGSVSSDNKVATFGDISGLGYITSVNSPLSVTSGALSIDLSGYLTTSDASSTYLTQSDASSTYLTQSSASSTYLTSSDASSTYLTQSDASSTYATQSSLGSYLTTSDASSTYLTQSSASSTYLTQSDASSTYATPTDITNAINNLVDNAPMALDTLNKLATAINDDASYASTITLALGGKQDTLTAGNGITITGTTIALDPNVVITQVSLTDTEIGVSADSVVFGNSSTSAFAKGLTNSIYTFDSNTVTSDILINIIDDTGNSRTSKVTAVHNGGESPVWTEYAIIDSVTTSALSVTISFSGDTFQVNVAGSGTYGIYATATNLY